MKPVTIVLADGEVLVRLGLRHLLSDDPSFEIVAEAADEEELFEELEAHRPSVIILDYNQPDQFSLSTVTRVKKWAPSSHILVISSDNDKKNIYQVLEQGVHSFLTKTCGEEEILDAVKATAKGDKFFCTRIIDYLLEKSFSKEEESCAPSPLSSREIEILQLIAKGLIAKEIAGLLNLSTHTVYTHRKNIMKKLNLSTSSELVLYAVNNGIVEKAT
jgi:DNA-binding NarL/FixJ family response regulator